MSRYSLYMIIECNSLESSRFPWYIQLLKTLLQFSRLITMLWLLRRMLLRCGHLLWCVHLTWLFRLGNHVCEWRMTILLLNSNTAIVYWVDWLYRVLTITITSFFLEVFLNQMIDYVKGSLQITTEFIFVLIFPVKFLWHKTIWKVLEIFFVINS
jgi:hypothetical protein